MPTTHEPVPEIAVPKKARPAPAVDRALKGLILQSLVHEKGGVLVYEAALACVKEPALEKEWTKYLAQTKEHVEVLTTVCRALGLDPDEKLACCDVVETVGRGLVAAMELARAHDPEGAQIVACECVVLAEVKDHLDWELLGQVAKIAEPATAKVLRDAVDRVEDEEDEHLYHTKGWCRELWRKSLGLDAVIPPPEETKHVKTAGGAAKVEAARAKSKKR